MKSDKLTKEEKEILAVLMINAIETENKEVEPWSCEQDCYAVYQSYCKGEHGVVKGF